MGDIPSVSSARGMILVARTSMMLQRDIAVTFMVRELLTTITGLEGFIGSKMP
ncbi:hypothetical protein EMCG_08297 [[Emmonsia] crescens]|uniref:Uncharacterized protein n=1 Tax=[Emmonsia] crescens TaxID=73230 RepID=A0A0G2J4K9_9EURO|nr:hypothetical protein EMCG_08297 [Emmonsia crescens UAMH 3008]